MSGKEVDADTRFFCGGKVVNLDIKESLMVIIERNISIDVTNVKIPMVEKIRRRRKWRSGTPHGVATIAKRERGDLKDKSRGRFLFLLVRAKSVDKVIEIESGSLIPRKMKMSGREGNGSNGECA